MVFKIKAQNDFPITFFPKDYDKMPLHPQSSLRSGRGLFDNKVKKTDKMHLPKTVSMVTL
jgi:hypothetical protein